MPPAAAARLAAASDPNTFVAAISWSRART